MSQESRFVARDLKPKPIIAGSRTARIGYLAARVKDDKKREEDEMMACPVPVVTIASVGRVGMETAVALMNLPLEIPIRAVLHLESLKRVELDLQAREGGQGNWKSAAKFTFQPFDDGSDVETELDRVLKYAEHSDFMLVDLVDSGNGLGVRGQFEKRHQKPGARRFWYVRQFTTPAMPGIE